MAGSAGKRWLLAWFALAAGATNAAGGHHSVDDAAIVDPGLCQIESWGEREGAALRTLLHAGLGCRAGAVELGIAAERLRFRDGPQSTSVTPQWKWATALSAHWSAGVVLSGVWQTGNRGGYQGATLLVPVTWQLSKGLQLHLNAGRDFSRHHADTARAGTALEWTPVSAWSAVAERYREGGANFWRLGGRWSPTPAVSVDLSRASGLHDGAAAWWTLGLTLAFSG